MVQIEQYIQELMHSMKAVFGSRLLYIGLQGSYLRKEATEESDIDLMVILNHLTVEDLDGYKQILLQLDHYEKSCGFICGMDEFSQWNPLELCHLVHSTKDYYGSLSSLLPQYSESDTINFIKVSLGNLYHEICHRYLHAERLENVEKLPQTYKQVFFILQNIYYLKAGTFCQTKKELSEILDGADQEIMQISLELSTGKAYNFEPAFEKLFLWCQNSLTKYKSDSAFLCCDGK